MGSCKKLVEVSSPVTSLTKYSVYQNDATAAAVLTGLYADMSANKSFIEGATSNIYLGLCSDELTLLNDATDLNDIRFYRNELNSQSAPNFWLRLYNRIFTVNSALEGLNATTTLSSAIKQQLLGEAKFIRALCYFYLVNLYGDIPLALSSDYRLNAKLERISKDFVYDQVITDLKEAEELLTDKYYAADIFSTTGDRVRPTKYAAAALLSRGYLYRQDWRNALAQADMVINDSTTYILEPDLNTVFLKESREAIWQLMPIQNASNNTDAPTLVLVGGPNTYLNKYYLSNNLLDSMEVGDLRKTSWINVFTDPSGNYYYAYKYKNFSYNVPVTEYLIVFRLAEQYLIRAEARAHLGQTELAKSDLNRIRNRAGLADTDASDEASLLAAIMHERKIELFLESGQRWFDLKRTGQADNVMPAITIAKGGTWQSTDKLFPIPATDTLYGPNLTQTLGY